MPSQSISQLTELTSISESSFFPVAQDGTTYKFSFSALTDSISGTSSNNYVTSGVTTGTTLTWDKQYWGISGSSEINLILPSTTGKDGHFLIIKDAIGTCGTYRIRLTPESGTIDGDPYKDMNINYMSLTIMARNNNWYIL